MDPMINELMHRVQEDQRRVYDLARLIPDGVYGKKAINLAWEALRLGWYMMRDDRIGIFEKTQFVEWAFNALMKELKEEQE